MATLLPSSRTIALARSSLPSKIICVIQALLHLKCEPAAADAWKACRSERFAPDPEHDNAASAFALGGVRRQAVGSDMGGFAPS
jgi:hypothetical protein